MLPGKAPGTGQYAETDICKTCHADVWEKHFAGTPHSALLKGDQHGCQGCHGPGQAHVDGGGDHQDHPLREAHSGADRGHLFELPPGQH